MRCRGIMLSLMLALFASPARGQEGPHVLLLRPSPPAGTIIIPAGVKPFDQLIIPRYADGKNHPAGRIIGWGGPSRIVGTAATKDQTLYKIAGAEQYTYYTNLAVPALVATEDADKGNPTLSQWAATGNATYPAVLWPSVSGVGIQGFNDTNGNYSTGGSVAGQPQSGNRRVGAVSNVANTTPIRITSTAHTLQTGAVVRIFGVDPAVDAQYRITRIDANVFDVAKRVGAVTNVANTAPIRITSIDHTLQTGSVVTISGVDPAVDGQYTITRISADLFDLDGTTAAGSFSSGEWESEFGTGALGSYSSGEWESLYWKDLYHGLVMRGSGGRLENVHVFYIPGTAVSISRPFTKLIGQSKPLDTASSKFMCRDIYISRAYRGIDFRATDGIIGRVSVHQVRDWAVRFGNAIQIDGAIHTYGGRIGCWLPDDADNSMGGPFYCEQSPIGMLIEASGCSLGPIYCHTNSDRSIRLDGTFNRLTNVSINQKIAGLTSIDVRQRGNTIDTSRIDLFNNALGIQIGDSTALGGGTGGNPSGRGLRITNLQVTISGTNRSGVAVQPRVPLNGCVIDVNLYATGTGTHLDGIDLTYAANVLGSGNWINVTSQSDGGATVTPIVLPSDWTTNASGKYDDNFIYVNGVRLLPGS